MVLMYPYNAVQKFKCVRAPFSQEIAKNFRVPVAGRVNSDLQNIGQGGQHQYLVSSVSKHRRILPISEQSLNLLSIC